MDPKRDCPVTVVGGGIVGICCALSLLEKGLRVRLVDRHAATKPASHGNAGVISPWSCIPQSMPGVWKNIPRWLLNPEGPVAVRYRDALEVLPWTVKFLKCGRAERVRRTVEAMAALNRHCIDYYRRQLAGTGAEHLLQDSWYFHVFAKASDASINNLGSRLRIEQGAPVEIIDGRELHEIIPQLADHYEAAIVIKDQARALSPGRICEVLTEKFRYHGGELCLAAVEQLLPQGPGESWRLITDRGEHRASKVVLAAGAWSTHLLAPIGVRVPLQPERGYHVTFRNPGFALAHSIMEANAMFVVNSMEDGLRSAGRAEFANIDAAPNYRHAAILERQTRRLLPALEETETAAWMGTRPSLPDSLPCIGGIPNQPGLLAAFGHSHYGMSMAPGTAQIIANCAIGERANIELSPYDIQRFER